MALSKRTTTFAALFRKKPPHWGLRGDPFLWNEMVQRFKLVACPSSIEGVRAVIEEAVLELTDHSMSHPDAIFVERYSHGGMSSGHVCPEFWRDTVVPMLLERQAGLFGGSGDPVE